MLKIPLQFSDGQQADLILRKNDFGDPFSLTLEIPPNCNGKIHLPKDMFSPSIVEKIEESR